MKTIHLASLCLITLFAYSAEAQDAEPAGTPQPPPSPPLVAAKVPPWCQWTVDYTYSATAHGDSAADRVAAFEKTAAQDPMVAQMMSNPNFLYSLTEPRPLHVAVAQTGDIRGEVRNLERGFVDECWIMGDAAVEKRPEGGPLVATLYPRGSDVEFPQFNWISTSNFAGRKKVNGIDCIIFKDKIDPMRISHPELPPNGLAPFIEVTASIAEQTRLPVALQTPTEARRYTFLPPPTAQLVPPPAFVAAAQDAKARVDASTRPLSPP
jgi:hypothetical protein